MTLDTHQSMQSTAILDVSPPSPTSNFVRVNLNLDEVCDREAIANTCARDTNASNECAPLAARPISRLRRLLGGVCLKELFEFALRRWASHLIDPFSLSPVKKSPDCVVPEHITSYIHDGMNTNDEGSPLAIAEDEIPHSIEEFTPTLDALADLPPEAAEAARYYADLQRKGGSFKVWQNCWKLIIAYCVRWGRSALPMTVGTATGIMLHMARVGYAYGYIRNVRWTVSKAHRLARLPDPTRDDGFCMYLRIVAKELGTDSVHRKAAILFKHLRQIGERAFALGTLWALQEWTAMNLEWFSVLRRENLVALNIEDCRRTERGGYEVHIRRGKNHQTSSRDIFIGPIPGDPLVCPVATLDRWLRTLKAAGITEGPLFRHRGLGGTLTEKRLSSRTLARAIKKYAAQVGLSPDECATQSMRRGMITQALINGVNQADLRQLTGHDRLESLDPYYAPGALAPNLSIAATYGVTRPDQLPANLINPSAVSHQALPAEVNYASA